MRAAVVCEAPLRGGLEGRRAVVCWADAFADKMGFTDPRSLRVR